MSVVIQTPGERWRFPPDRLRWLLLVLLPTLPLSASAALLTVGPQGEHASLQAAVDAAATLPGDHDIRIQRGTYLERVQIDLTGGVLVITGGWTSDFDEQQLDAANTTLSSTFNGRPLSITGSSGILILAGLTIAGGVVDSDHGGGILVDLDGPATVVVSDVSIALNRVNYQLGTHYGAGVAATVRNGGSFVLRDCEVANNDAGPGSKNVLGAVYLAIWQQGFARMQRCRIGNNLTTRNIGLPTGITAILASNDLGELELLDNFVHNNPGLSPDHQAIRIVGGGRIRVERNRIVDDSPTVQVSMLTSQWIKTLLVRNNLIAGGSVGLYLQSGQAVADHNTIVGFSHTGVHWNGPPSWHNNIVYGNGPASNINPPAGNLTGVDPGFVDPAAGNYRLAAHSPARDTAVAIPDLPAIDHDIEFNPRPFGPASDIGAFELGDVLFADGFQ